MKFICALVVVEDIQKSRYLYETILGQTVKADFGENITFHGDFALHQKSHFKSLIRQRPITSRSNNFELYFESDDLEAIEKKINDHGLTFIHGVVEQPWRQKVIRFYDFDFNIIEVGETMPHVAYRLFKEGIAIGEISQITYLSEDDVNKAIKLYS